MDDSPAQNEQTDDAPAPSSAPAQVDPAPPAGRPHIVVGVDGSDSSIGALRIAIRMAEALALDLVAIAAWKYPAAGGGYPPADWSPEDDCRAALQEATAQVFGEQIPDWFTSEVREGSATRVLLDASREAQLLVVGSRGHGGFTGLLLGSVSSTCAEYAKCPVLVNHPPLAPARDASA